HPECTNLHVLKVQFLHAGEVGGVLFVRGRETAFDEIEPQAVEPLGNQQLVLEREVNAFALAAVPQSGVIHLNATHGLLSRGSSWKDCCLRSKRKKPRGLSGLGALFESVFHRFALTAAPPE